MYSRCRCDRSLWRWRNRRSDDAAGTAYFSEGSGTALAHGAGDVRATGAVRVLRRRITRHTSGGLRFPQGTWLNLVLPFAWCFLAAQAILQDSLVGDKQFWVALPCSWRTLLLAKITFIGSTIALPYLIATSAILIARTHSIRFCISRISSEATSNPFAVLILAAALATVTRNIGQFLLAEITVLSGTMFLGSPTGPGGQAFRSFPWDVRWSLALIILSAGGLVVVMTQFAARRPVLSRALAVLAVIAAAALYNEMSRDTSAAIVTHLAPAP